MSKNIVFEGWLTKSPPSKRIWRTKWRRRWFLLRQSGELPGQYFLDYYADRNCRRLKGTINLDFCEQVDAGLHMERSSHASLKPRLRGSVFTIQTQTRTYHLQADCEADMEKWVDAICRVCGLRATDEESKSEPPYRPALEVHQESIPMQAIRERHSRYSEIVLAANNLPMTTFGNANEQQIQPVKNDRSHVTITTNAQIECSESTGPYIPISECITGVRVQDVENKFTFDPKNMVKIPIEKSEERRLMNPPQIRINNIELSENESNFSEDECRSLNPSQSNVGERSVSRSFTKMSLGPKRNVHSTEGPPVPPRPPKSFIMYKDIVVHKNGVRIHKHQEPESTDRTAGNLWVRNPRRKSHGVSPPSTSRSVATRSCVRTTDDEEDAPAGTSMQYYNITSPPPPVIDRGLKPRYSTLNPSNTNTAFGPVRSNEETKADKLQYLDLDLPQVSSKPSTSHSHDNKSSSESEPAYKTVDFLKTEAFNITRQDAEASRSVQQ